VPATAGTRFYGTEPMKRKLVLLTTTTLCAAIIGTVYLNLRSAPEASVPAARTVFADPAPGVRPDGQTLLSASDPALELAVLWLERFGESIHEAATQARLYPERQALLEARPRDGKPLFQRAVETAFPDHVDGILSLMTSLDHYHDWLDLNELRLQALPPMPREVEIWQQRDALFGALASEIWGDETSYLEERSDAFQRHLAELDQSAHLPLPELAHQLQTSAREVYGSDLNQQFAGSGALGHALLSLTSVQSQLAGLPADERQAAIDGLRQQLGYSDLAIERMADQDRANEEKWQNGYRYMAQRQALAQRLAGDELNNALESLREEHFGIAAPTIAREEEEGFYRFERPRRYGLN